MGERKYRPHKDLRNVSKGSTPPTSKEALMKKTSRGGAEDAEGRERVVVR